MTSNELFRSITEEILDYEVREMMYIGANANDQQLRPGPQLPSNATGKVGGVVFYSSQDAGSKGEEGGSLSGRPTSYSESWAVKVGA